MFPHLLSHKSANFYTASLASNKYAEGWFIMIATSVKSAQPQRFLGIQDQNQ